MRTQVLVVGGGPAGLAAATALARRDVAVALIEAGTWPRPKMCGEFLSPDSERALADVGAGDVVRRFGAPAIDALRATVSRGGRVVADASSALAVPGHGVARVDLDSALAEAARAAGVDVRDRTRVDSIAVGDECVRAVAAAGEFRADAVVVATGRVPGVGRDESSPSREWIAVKTHVRGPRLPRVTELHFVDAAYVGLNEVACRGERVVNVCALARRDAWERAGASPDGLWDALCRASPAFAARWNASTPVDGSFVAAAGFGFEVRGARGDGARPPLFVGDAAALIAPLCGDGQSMALAGGAALGALLAERSRRAVRVRPVDGRAAAGRLDPSGVRDAADAWDDAFRARFHGRLALGRVLQATLLNPRAAALLVRAAAGIRPVAGWLYRRTRGRVEPRPS